jgi:hypothetical protein
MGGLRDTIRCLGTFVLLFASGTLAAQQGLVSGLVVDGFDQPVADTPVHVIEATERVYLGAVLTNADGTYAALLPSGGYYLVADGPGFTPRAHDGTPCPANLLCDFDTIVPLTLPASSVLEDIDFTLEWTGGISGQVVGTQGEGLAGVLVYAFHASNLGVARTLFANADGSYFLPLPPGGYLVAVQRAGYASILYDGVRCLAACDAALATQVAVVLDAVSDGVDFETHQVSTIAGHITTTGGAALAGAVVAAYTTEADFVASTTSGPSGDFLLDIEPGAYILFASAAGHRAELYDDQPCTPVCYIGEATPVALPEGDAVTGIDFALDPAGFLAGRVTLADGTTPVAGVTVLALQQGRIEGQFTTAADGTYYLVPLVGEVRLRTLNIDGLIDVAYPDLPCLLALCDAGVGQPIPISAGQSVGGVDFALSPGGAISGMVRNTRGRTLDGVATLFDDAGVPVASIGIHNGQYRFDGLPSMDYSLRFDADGYDSQRYDGLPCTPQDCDPLAADAVEVTAPQERGGIDAILDGDGPLQILYLNDCLPSGCVVTRVNGGPEVENSITNTSSIAGGTLGGWNLGPEAFEALTACVRAAFVPYRIAIVTADPGPVSHREAMVGGLPAQLGLPAGVWGAAQYACSHPDGIANSISFTFSGQIGDSIADICRTVAHEIGHQFGLDHAFHAPDYMSYLEDPFKRFTSDDVSCGTTASAPCQCGAPTQNSDAQLRGILGITVDIFASGFEPVPPARSWQSWPRSDAVGAPFVCGTGIAGGG